MNGEPEELKLDDYCVLKREDGSHWLLGRGEYGTTYKAKHTMLGRIVALKVINDHLITNDRAKQRFINEARAAATLNHENIAEIYSFGETNGIFYYAMSYCSGGDLEEFSAKHGPQPWSIVKQMALQILGALAAAHEKRMLHRDLKPSNIMLAEDDGSLNLRLIDFGLVKIVDEAESPNKTPSLTMEGAFMGNPLTASPEQFREEALDERCDLFSLGVTLWCVLNGGSPFGKVTAAQIAHQRLSGEIYRDLLPADLDPSGRYVIGKLLAKDKDQRFQTAREAIEAILEGAKGGDEPDTQVVVSSALGIAATAPEPSLTGALDEDWQFQAMVRQFDFGSFYSCVGTGPGAAQAALFVPNADSSQSGVIQRNARQLLRDDPRVLIDFKQEGTFEGAPCFLCSALPPADFDYLLKEVGHLSLQYDLPLFQQLAQAIDEASARGIPGAELGEPDILLGVSSEFARPPQTAEEWASYFANEGRSEGGHTAGLKAVVFPKLAEPSVTQSTSVTISDHELARSILARFGGVLYKALSGMIVHPGAYVSPGEHVPIPTVSEVSNRYLARVIAAEEEPESAMHLLRNLCSFETLPWNTEQLHNDLAITIAGSATLGDPPTEQAAAAATAPPAFSSAPEAQVATSPPPRPHSGRKKPIVLIVSIAAAVVALTVAGILFIPGMIGDGDRRSKKRSHTELGIGLLHFPKFVMRGSPPPGSIQVHDSSGTPLGEFIAEGGKASVEDFPMEVFESETRWPLEIRLGTGTEGLKMEIHQLVLDDFVKGEGNERTYPEQVNLAVRAYIEIEPVVSLDGAPLDSPAPLLVNLLQPEARGKGWLIQAEGPRLKISLPPGEKFPIDATLDLDIPCISGSTVSLGSDGGRRWQLELKKREVKLIGLPAFSSMTFNIQYSLISNPSVAAFLRKSVGNLKISAQEFAAAAMKWELPEIEGMLSIAGSSSAAKAELDRDTRVKVFVNGMDAEPDERGSLRSLRAAAERGLPESQRKLALEYQKIGADKRRIQWLFLAEQGGDLPARVSLGAAYLAGDGVNKDEVKGYQLILKAQKQGDSSGKADNNLAYCFQYGKGVEKNHAAAQKHYEGAIELGYTEALVNLGIMLSDENCTVKNPVKAVELIREAHEAGLKSGTRELGYCYFNGIGGLTVDKATAIELITKAADEGDGQAMEMLKDLR